MTYAQPRGGGGGAGERSAPGRPLSPQARPGFPSAPSGWRLLVVEGQGVLTAAAAVGLLWLQVVVEQGVLTKASAELTMAQASAIADNTLEHTVRATLWALRWGWR